MDVNELSEEVKAKMRECKSAEELRALAEEEGIELTDELLEAVSGGSEVAFNNPWLKSDVYDFKN